MSIDGELFSQPCGKGDEVDGLFNTLRRQFAPVYDARVTDKPAEVARGKPNTVIIGSARLDVAHAFVLAVLTGPQSRLATA